jgi:mRNA N6-methyladenine demethylase
MGTTNKNKKQKSQPPSAIKNCNSLSRKQSAALYPLPFPPHLKYPEKSFLRNEGPFANSFQEALETSYEGFVFDNPHTLEIQQSCIEEALLEMENAGYFRVDITQPFGLGTKCAKTYVTRCLVGDPGTTYKYLGLRMFSHNWKPQKSLPSKEYQALQTIGDLNTALTERTRVHLTNLQDKRENRGVSVELKGRVGFDIALINRMESPVGLKNEPSLGEGKCSVSWHADSSLEHFSSIAVYHLLSKEADENGKWSIGLRVAVDSEGPQASRRGGDIIVDPDTPPLAISLPSGSSYYMLDDFNHHHQHAVIAEGNVPGRRFSSTHRLLRESHNVAHMISRCKSACANFHKKGAKLWRSEQLLLTELESEWLHQFFIQGKAHYDLLWEGNWKGPIEQLLSYWSLLEDRTKQTIDWLKLAVEAQCGVDAFIDSQLLSRMERKLHDKRKKALKGLSDLMDRKLGEASIRLEVYESLASLLEERATMREMWLKRERDGVFHDVPFDDRPMPLPVEFNCHEIQKNKGKGQSRMPGSFSDLRDIASQLRHWGRAFESGNKQDLLMAVSKMITDSPPDEHSQSLDWEGWKTNSFGLEMQEPWARYVTDGIKSIETRAYTLPPALIGQKIVILQSQQGKTGVSALTNKLDLTSDIVKRIGWCTFSNVIEYRDQFAFEADEKCHLVKSTDKVYGWKAGVTEKIFGWVVGDYGLYEPEIHDGVRCIAVRRFRSLFQLGEDTNSVKRKSTLSTKESRKRKKHQKRK